jgi:hypothetical protein
MLLTKALKLPLAAFLPMIDGLEIFMASYLDNFSQRNIIAQAFFLHYGW